MGKIVRGALQPVKTLYPSTWGGIFSLDLYPPGADAAAQSPLPASPSHSLLLLCVLSIRRRLKLISWAQPIWELYLHTLWPHIQELNI